MQNRFENPATGETYNWHQNHAPDGEEMTGKQRTINRLPGTAPGTVILQQGDDGAYTIKLRGTILMRVQHQAFLRWWKLSRTQTIFFTDFDNQKYEVQITSYMSKRKGKLTSIGKDPSMRTHTYDYEIEMVVINFLSGDMAAAGILA